MIKVYDPKEMGSLLLRLRLKANLTTKQLAKRSGYSPEFIWAIEKGDDTLLSVSVLLVMLDAMEYDWLIQPRPKKIHEQLVESLVAAKKAKKK